MATRKLLHSTAVTGGMTLVSRISGLVRDVVFASAIGAGAGVAADAFYVAFRIPNFLRRIFGEGAFSQAFVPVLAEYRAQRSLEETRKFLGHLTGRFATVLLGVTVIGVVAAPALVFLQAPGFLNDAEHPEKFAVTVDLLRLTFPYIFFISLVAMSAGILNTYRHFAAAAFTPVLLNLCLIAAALWLAPQLATPVMALAWGVLIAGVVQLLFQLPHLSRIGMLPVPRAEWRKPEEGVRRVLKLMLPAIFGVSIAQINTLLNTVLASFLVTGSVSWLYYSDRLMEFPVGVFGMALATVILPSLSSKHVSRSHEEFSRLLDWALRWAAVICVPATVGLIVLADPLIATIYYRGAFTLHDVAMSSAALVAFSAGLPAFIAIKVLAPGFYARQDTRTPVRIGVIAMAVNVVLSLVLVFPFRHVGLAAAISVAAVVNASLLYISLRRQSVFRPLSGWLFFLARVVLASAVMGMVLIWGADSASSWTGFGSAERIWRLAFWVIAGIVIYGAMIVALGLRPAQLLLRYKPGMFQDDA